MFILSKYKMEVFCLPKFIIRVVSNSIKKRVLNFGQIWWNKINILILAKTEHNSCFLQNTCWKDVFIKLLLTGDIFDGIPIHLSCTYLRLTFCCKLFFAPPWQIKEQHYLLTLLNFCIFWPYFTYVFKSNKCRSNSDMSEALLHPFVLVEDQMPEPS